MTKSTREVIESHWSLSNSRSWDAFRELLHPALQYDAPQTREYVESGEGYLEMFRTWPGDWKAKIQSLVCEEDKAVCIIDFVVEDEVMTGISLFRVEEGKIVQVTDYWPSPYEPAARSTPHMKRRDQ